MDLIFNLIEIVDATGDRYALKGGYLCMMAWDLQDGAGPLEGRGGDPNNNKNM